MTNDVNTPGIEWLEYIEAGSPTIVIREDSDGNPRFFKVSVEEVEGL